MKKALWLVVISLIMILPSALALNCTEYHGDKRELCNNIDPLEISESDKLSLMADSIYGSINPPDPSINLSLNKTNETPITLETIYNKKVVFLGRFAILFFFVYSTYSIVTKSSFMRKWLNVDY